MTERRGPVADGLQDQLRDLLVLTVVGDHVRWVLTGDDAEELRLWLRDAVPRWRSWADQVATRLVALGVPPDGRVRSLARDIPLNWVPDGWLSSEQARRLVDQRVRSAAGRARHRCSQATDTDTVQLLDAICTGLGHTR